MTENKTILRLKGKVSIELYNLLTKGNILQLTLKKEWFEMIAIGEKKEEYREIKPYWAKRFVSTWSYIGENRGLFPNAENTFMSSFDINGLTKYDAIIFQNGYGNVPTMIVESKGLEVKTGLKKWGAVENEAYFTHLLGDVLYCQPCI